ncbi:MAG: hypothetical protein ABSD62_15510 [Candidatus Limnocylindrales bacterium]
MDDLDTLLREAATADAGVRIESRDRIAAFGVKAIARLEPWLSDPRLGAFAVRTIERAADMPGAALVAKAALQRANASGPQRDDVAAALTRLRRRARASAPPRSGDDRRLKRQSGMRTVDEVLGDLRELLIEHAARRQLMTYSDTGLNRRVVGNRLDDINRSEHQAGRPLLSVIVVHKGATMPGEGFFMCARDLGRYQEGQDRAAFVKQEREAVFKAWAR